MRTEQISEQRWRLLLRLLLEEQHGNPHVNPTHLANTQQVSKNTISSLLRSLEEQRLIERTLDQDDRRQFHIRLTEAGRQLVRDSARSYRISQSANQRAFSRDEVNNLHQLCKNCIVLSTPAYKAWPKDFWFSNELAAMQCLIVLGIAARSQWRKSWQHKVLHRRGRHGKNKRRSPAQPIGASDPLPGQLQTVDSLGISIAHHQHWRS